MLATKEIDTPFKNPVSAVDDGLGGADLESQELKPGTCAVDGGDETRGKDTSGGNKSLLVKNKKKTQ